MQCDQGRIGLFARRHPKVPKISEYLELRRYLRDEPYYLVILGVVVSVLYQVPAENLTALIALAVGRDSGDRVMRMHGHV